MAATDRATLSRELIADTALQITDNEGLDGLSMRKLGSALGVEAMSLYHYIDNKDDLLDAVVDNLYGEIELPTDVPDDDWEQAFRSGLRSFYDVLLGHPAALELFTTRPSRSANALTVMGWSFNRCRMVGMTPLEASQAFRFAVAFVIGHAASELGILAQIEPENSALIEAGRAVDPEFAEFLAHHHNLRGDAMFDAGLEMVCSSLAANFGLSRV
jgi:AcrR family transcriptional regulator